MAYMQGDSERAIALYRESLSLFQDERDMWGVAIQLQRLGMAERSRGHGTQAQMWYRQSLTVAQELGDTGVIVECVEGLAGVACAAERPQRGARLLGAAAALRVARGTPVRPAERAMYERDVEAARAALGAEVFETMWAAGQSMTADAVIAEVLAGDDVATG